MKILKAILKLIKPKKGGRKIDYLKFKELKEEATLKSIYLNPNNF